MKPKYRVEAFIVPISNSSQDELSSSNEMDDVKAANKSIKKCDDSQSEDDKSKLSTSRESLEDLKIKLMMNDIEEPIYDVPYVQAAPFANIQRGGKHKIKNETTITTKLPIRTSSLMSIDERGESDGILEEFCFRGYTTPAQRPEQVSEEIFKENWLRRLENLRERESSLREKEILLEEREKLLFNKEKELRILERLVNEKLKQAELYLKRSKSSQSINSGSRESSGSQRSSVSTAKSNYSQSLESCTSGQTKKTESSTTLDPLRYNRDEQVSLGRYNSQSKQSISSLSSGNSDEKIATKCGSLAAPLDLARSHVGSSKFITRSTAAGCSAYSSLRCKPRPAKMTYDDLDSTLSADIGDSSYVVTSKKFDPELFKRPYAFTRSASERRSTPEQERNSAYKAELREKLLKRVSENIFTCQDKNTIYQNYGLIDPTVKSIDADDVKESYLSLPRNYDSVNPKNSRMIKERPVSWNEETNEWLRKKRHAYNMATRRMPTDDFENKENVDASSKREKTEKCTKKSSKINKFAIFR